MPLCVVSLPGEVIFGFLMTLSSCAVRSSTALSKSSPFGTQRTTLTASIGEVVMIFSPSVFEVQPAGSVNCTPASRLVKVSPSPDEDEGAELLSLEVEVFAGIDGIDGIVLGELD